MNSAPINLVELRAGFSGTQFRELIRHHLEQQSQDVLIKSLLATVAILPDSARPLAEGFIDRWNTRIYDQKFWESDTATVFDVIIADARRALRPLGLAEDDETVFNMFNIVVVNFAVNASGQPKTRRFMQIGTRFPWLSALCLLYPISATIYMATSTPAGPAMVVGYGIGNLGYVLLAAGILTGTFRIFGLIKRWQVLTLAALLLVMGTVLCSLD